MVLLAHEFCSQTFLLDDLSMTNIVSSTLFGDGVAATVISGKLNSPRASAGHAALHDPVLPRHPGLHGL